MTHVDYAVLLLYAVGLFAIGGIFSTRLHDSAEMFAAGGRSPWWVAGLSGFMTIFSAGTFVVWGGIAYRLGLVSVSILIGAGGISSLLVGRFLAGRWRRLGITTPAEYVRLRFGPGAVQVYTWLNVLAGTIGLGAGLYSLSVMLAALIPLRAGHPLTDAETGHLAVVWATLIGGLIVVGYTMAGGLWAVLMTDVIQAIVLGLAVAVVAPLSILKLGGWSRFIEGLPAGFLSPAAGEFTWGFLLLWAGINTILYGGQWPFVQRYLCVPTPRDARKAAYLMGGLYLICPIIWMLPAMAYRVMNPSADPEQAYVLVSQAVLPAGMLGIMVAAMFSATASMVSSLLNVFAGVVTRDIYRPLLYPDASERHLVIVGRIATAAYGLLVIGMALSVPYLGGAEEVVLPLVMLLLGPMVVPLVWGLFSKRIRQRDVWITMIVSAAASALTKFGLAQGRIAPDSQLSAWVAAHLRLMEGICGLLLPLTVLGFLEFTTRSEALGARRLQDYLHVIEQEAEIRLASMLPARIVAWALSILGLVTVILAVLADEQRLVLTVFAAMLLLISGAIVLACRRRSSIRPECDSHAPEGGVCGARTMAGHDPRTAS